MMLGFAFLFINVTIMTVEVPAIGASMNANFATVELAVTLFMVVAGGLLVTMGQLGDHIGRRRLLVIGCVDMIVSSVIIALAPNMTVLLAGRVIQAAGFAMIAATAVGLLNVIFASPPARSIAFGTFGVAFGVGIAAGNLLGGAFTEELSWRWAFWLNVPVFAVVLLGVLWTLPESKTDDPNHEIDWLGTFPLAIGLAALIFALAEGHNFGWIRPIRALSFAGYDWSGPLSIVAVLLIASVAILAIFTAYEHGRYRRGRSVLLDVDLFKLREFGIGSIVAAFFVIGLFGLLILLPTFFQLVRGYDALAVGYAILPLGLGAIVLGAFAAPIGHRLGGRNAVLAGLAIAAVGAAAMIPFMTPDANIWLIAIPLFVAGGGSGLTYARLNDILLSVVPTDKAAVAGGMAIMIRIVSGSIGAAILTVILLTLGSGKAVSQIEADTTLSSHEKTVAIETIERTSRTHVTNAKVEEIVLVGRGTIADSFQIIFGVGAITLVVAFCVTLLIPSDKPPVFSPSSRRPQRSGTG